MSDELNSDTKSKIKRFFNAKRNRWITGAFICALLGLMVWVSLAFLLPKSKPEQTVNDLATSTTKNLTNGKTGTAAKDLEAFVNSNASKDDKLSAYIFLALTYRTQGRNDDALKALSEAEGIQSDIGYSGFSLAATIYEEKGDKKTAVVYYERAIQSMKDSPEKSDDLYLDQYNKKVQELSK
mgnify:CR=1 FL=1